jgi:hypothetical protein
MYPPVTQFETSHNRFREEQLLRETRAALRPQQPRRRRPFARWLARALASALPVPRRAGRAGSR